jgi:Tfp pilus assembly protein PilX
MKTRVRRSVTPLGEQGLALPLALLGLVAVTLLVTTVLLTSGTEFAVSSAQRDASKSLYDANAALEQYVATRAQQAASSTRFVEGTTTTTFNGATYDLSLAQISRVKTVETNTHVEATDTWSIIAAPQSKGRGVGALVQVTRTLDKLVLNVSAGATSGGNFSVGGNSTVSNGRSGQVNCASGDTVAASVQVTAGSSVSQSGNSTLEGQADTSDVVKDSLMNSVLGRGVTLDTLAKYANIKFGARFGQPEWSNTRVNQSNTGTDSVYNWGCPQSDLDNVTCTAAAASRFVVVAIDATNQNNQGGLSHAVTINGDYGQGILIVLNGSLNVQGNFIFRGIVLVDKDLSIGGGSGGNSFSGKIEGTVVAFGTQSTVEDNVNGTATIRYNKCSVVDAQNALNNGRLDDMPQVLSNSTFAWYELVR